MYTKLFAYIEKHIKLCFTFCLGVNIIQTEKGNCSKDSRMVEYSDNCAKYIDCKDKTTTGEPNVKECPFPLLFDDKSQKCEHFSMVRCGTRYEPKDACKSLSYILKTKKGKKQKMKTPMRLIQDQT